MKYHIKNLLKQQKMKYKMNKKKINYLKKKEDILN